ncbi:MAG: site-specific integrase [Gammaproteobacteria bacterium]|nr:site-specific integrase [Gammaproteobacteria bacterium]MBU1732247.1 site-specific integrase [Gammaproteobacteria bacterium]MBU1893817.1 site-specific integrase [Gammaproteobacteria bacterium]
MATKRKRGPSWEYIIRRKGILPKPVSFTFSDEAEGDAYAARVEAMLDHGIIPPEFEDNQAEVKTLADTVREYHKAVSVPYTDGALLGVVLDRYGKTPLTKITYTWTEAWVASMKRELNLAPSTIRHYVGATARCLDWLVRKSPGVMPHNPLRLLPKRYASYSGADAVVGEAKEDESRDRRLKPGEEGSIRAILSGARPEGRQRPLALQHGEALTLLFDLALETAMRMREMYTLYQDQIDLAKKTVFLNKTKNGDKRQVPLSSVAMEKLGGYLLVADGDQLFPWWDGRKESLKATTAKLSQQFARVFEAAGCPDLRFHDLRHEATSRIFERTNMSDLQIAKITGHKDPRMLARYANLRGSDLAELMW